MSRRQWDSGRRSPAPRHEPRNLSFAAAVALIASGASACLDAGPRTQDPPLATTPPGPLAPPPPAPSLAVDDGDAPRAGRFCTGGRGLSLRRWHEAAPAAARVEVDAVLEQHGGRLVIDWAAPGVPGVVLVLGDATAEAHTLADGLFPQTIGGLAPPGARRVRREIRMVIEEPAQLGARPVPVGRRVHLELRRRPGRSLSVLLDDVEVMTLPLTTPASERSLGRLGFGAWQARACYSHVVIQRL